MSRRVWNARVILALGLMTGAGLFGSLQCGATPRASSGRTSNAAVEILTRSSLRGDLQPVG